MLKISVSEVMESPVETIEPAATAREAAKRLDESGIGSLVIVDGDRPAGIITDVDLTRLLAAGQDPQTTTVDEIMSSPAVTVGVEETITAAATTLKEHEIKRLPVVDEDGALVGIVTTTDLTNYLPHVTQSKRAHATEESDERHDVRADTAYEEVEWHSEYFGAESHVSTGDVIRFSKTISADDVEVFAEASGDTNRLHLEDDYAVETRFDERIAHGTLVAGTISAALARLPGLTVYLSQEVSYLGPVPIGESVTATCRVVEQLKETQFRLETTVIREDGETVIDGEAVVLSDPIPDV